MNWLIIKPSHENNTRISISSVGGTCATLFFNSFSHLRGQPTILLALMVAVIRIPNDFNSRQSGKVQNQLSKHNMKFWCWGIPQTTAKLHLLQNSQFYLHLMYLFSIWMNNKDLYGGRTLIIFYSVIGQLVFMYGYFSGIKEFFPRSSTILHTNCYKFSSIINSTLYIILFIDDDWWIGELRPDNLLTLSLITHVWGLLYCNMEL